MNRAAAGNLVIRASAGSGKTFRLTNRYLELLASGVPPAQIWAATFTRKAAGEILSRVLERLLNAAVSDEKALELATHLKCPELARPDFVRLLRDVLGNIHRVRIGTLDSLFLKLAGTFALECGLPPGWSICDDVEDQAARESALDAVLAGDPERQSWLASLYERLRHGESRRGVRADLLDRTEKWYAAYREIPMAGWQCEPPASPADSLDALLEQLSVIDLSKEKGIANARDADCDRARQRKWEPFASTGVAAKVFHGESKFGRRPIPPALVYAYQRLRVFAGHEVQRDLGAETAALWDLLDEFHRHRENALRDGGSLRFEDVTRALAEHICPEADGFHFRIDGGIGHLLLDEFQDTSATQWAVLRKLALERLDAGGTFFAVGDVKQAIYGWRGGRVELLQRLPEELGGLPEESLDESRRSEQEIVDVVNTVFANVPAHVEGEWWMGDKAPWNGDFRTHQTVRHDRPGFVNIETGPAQGDDTLPASRERHLTWVARKIADLVEKHPTATVGVLCRTNAAVGRLLHDLRQLDVEASEEGGNRIDDLFAVDVILSLLTLADHPGDTIAAFHLEHSPIIGELKKNEFTREAPAAFAVIIRAALIADGYAAVVSHWASKLAELCPRADRLRLSQLVELADAYQSQATLRPADFVAWVRAQKVSAPTASRVRVLTLHKAKGLEFDAVVLPQLDVALKGRAGDFIVVDPDPEHLPHGFFGRRANSELQPLLDDTTRKHIAAAERRTVEEMLSGLYVALTRPREALYAFPPGPQSRARKYKDAWDTVLLKALGSPEAAHVKERKEHSVVYTRGTPDWQPEKPETQEAAPRSAQPIRFRTSTSQRRVEWVAPSGLEGGRVIDATYLFADSDPAAREIGVLHHAWYEAIEWLDAGEPTDDALRAIAGKLPYSRDDLAGQLARFRAALRVPAIRGRLSRSHYAQPMRVERERAFAVRTGSQMVNGRIDRLVWYRAEDGTQAMEVIDFKTDVIPREAVPARVMEYRPQIDAYIRAVALFAHLPLSRVSAVLLFTSVGCIERISCAGSDRLEACPTAK